MRGILAIAMAITGAVAQASFELVMAVDRGTKSVHRFDGGNGVYLGSFGGGYLQNPMAIALDQAHNRVFVADHLGTGNGSTQARVRLWSFNYNTGEYLNSALTVYGYTNPQLSYANGKIALGHDAAIADVFNAETLTLATTFNWSGTLTAASGLAFQDSMLWAYSGSQIFSRNLTTSVQTFYTMTSPIANSVVSGQRQLAISGNRALAAGGISFSMINLAGLSTSVSNTAPSTITSYNQVNGAGFGHGDIAYVAGVTGTTGGISRILYSEGLQLATFGNGILQEPRGLAIVVAPEPGTMLALGGGLVALIRQRKRRR